VARGAEHHRHSVAGAPASQPQGARSSTVARRVTQLGSALTWLGLGSELGLGWELGLGLGLGLGLEGSALSCLG